MVDIITLDFETYYAKDYTLSKLTTEEYIRDPRYETIGVGVKVNNGVTEWFSGDDAGVAKFLAKFKLGSAVVVAHNAPFDMAILSWIYDIHPLRIVDTLSMARAVLGPSVSMSLASLAQHFGLGVKGTAVNDALGKRRCDFSFEALAAYGEYCINDVDLTYDLFHKLADGFPINEFKLIDLTIRMFTEPRLVLDKGLLISHYDKVVAKKESLLNAVGAHKDELMSNPKFAEILRGLLVTPPMKISPTTGKETYAFSKSDDEFKALLEHPDIRVQCAVAARLGVKSTLEETRTERLIGLADRGALPVPLRYYGAHTGRWSGDEKMNLQNLPRGSDLKKAIKAPDGYVVVDSDSSQIEARTLAWLSGQNDLVDAFNRGEDVYKQMASAIYGVPETGVTKDQRFLGKTAILGCGYGLGAVRFQIQLRTMGVELSLEECERIIYIYRTTYTQIPLLWKQAQRAIVAMVSDMSASLGVAGVLSVEGRNGIRLPNGLYLKYPNIRAEDKADGKVEYFYDTKKGKATIPTRIYGGKLVENVCQALARIVIGEQMVAVSQRYIPVLTVHDAIASLARVEEAEEAQAFIEQCMRKRPVWAPDLPLNCEAGWGPSYGEC